MKVLSGHTQGCKSVLRLGYTCVAHPGFPLCLGGAQGDTCSPSPQPFVPLATEFVSHNLQRKCVCAEEGWEGDGVSDLT